MSRLIHLLCAHGLCTESGLASQGVTGCESVSPFRLPTLPFSSSCPHPRPARTQSLDFDECAKQMEELDKQIEKAIGERERCVARRRTVVWNLVLFAVPVWLLTVGWAWLSLRPFYHNLWLLHNHYDAFLINVAPALLLPLVCVGFFSPRS